MAKLLSPETVAKMYGVSRGTVIQWCRSGLMSSVDVSGPNAQRRRWRMSDSDLAAFEAKRANTRQDKSS